MNPFEVLGLSQELLTSVKAAGFEMPTPVQKQAIPVILSGRDLIAQAQTGTGKTAAFALPLIDGLDPSVLRPQALVLCPTRELAVQVAGVIHNLGKFKALRVLPVYGGQPIDRQLRALRPGVHAIIATPGRLLDHIRRGSVDLTNVTKIILDEADEMLAMGFIEDIEAILEGLPGERQTCLFSATIPPAIARLSGKFLKDPQRLVVAMEAQQKSLIRQSYYEVSPGKKLEALARILDMESPGSTIVFCRTRQDSNDVAENLRSQGYMADSLHGDLNQAERDRVMARFREGQVDLLVATDVASRGLDIESVTHVINLDVPWDAEAYTHRIGRTGRAGREGDALTLIYPKERRQLKAIEQATRSRFQPLKIPTTRQISERRLEELGKGVREQAGLEAPAAIATLAGKLLEDVDPAVAVTALLKLLWDEKHTGATLTEEEIDAALPPEQGMIRLFINVGRLDGLRPGDLVGAITNEAGLPGKSVGAIDILDRIAFFEVPRDRVEDVKRALERTKIRGRKVRIDLAREDARERPARRGPPRFQPHALPRPGKPRPPGFQPSPGPGKPGRKKDVTKGKKFPGGKKHRTH